MIGQLFTHKWHSEVGSFMRNLFSWYIIVRDYAQSFGITRKLFRALWLSSPTIFCSNSMVHSFPFPCDLILGSEIPTFLHMAWQHSSRVRVLTHWGRVTHICVNKVGHHWFRLWLVTWPAPSHYLNQRWNIVDYTIGNKLQWNINRN